MTATTNETQGRVSPDAPGKTWNASDFTPESGLTAAEMLAIVREGRMVDDVREAQEARAASQERGYRGQVRAGVAVVPKGTTGLTIDGNPARVGRSFGPQGSKSYEVHYSDENGCLHTIIVPSASVADGLYGEK